MKTRIERISARLVKTMLFLVSVLWLTEISAQTQRIAISEGVYSIEQVIRRIEKQTELTVGVNHMNFDVSRTVKVTPQYTTAKQLLDLIVSKTGHTYMAKGNYVIIVQRDKPAGRKRKKVVAPAPFVMEEGLITLAEEEEYEEEEPEVREYKTVAFEGDTELAFYISDPDQAVRVSDIRIGKQDEDVVVDFLAVVRPRTVSGNRCIEVSPVLRTDTSRLELPSMSLKGRRYRLSQERQARNNEQPPADSVQNIHLHNGDTLAYSQTLPAVMFGEDTELVFEASYADCRFTTEEIQAGADGFVELHREVIMPPTPPRLTTGDRIARDYPFVEMEPDMIPLKPDRSKALTVYYELDKYDLKFDYRNNNRSLSQMLSAINIIKDSHDSEITHIVLTGFASPEGPAARNEVLGHNRAEVLRNFLAERTGLDKQTFVMYNGGSDWDGLFRLIERLDEPWKDRVLDILENTPQAQRMATIKKLDKGWTYKHLLDKVLPDLRNASYVKVYYRNK